MEERLKILVTGFDPFGGEPINPAIETVKRLPDTIGRAEIIKLEIPTVCHKSLHVIDEAIAKYDPDVVLSIGQAGGRPDITVERVGINVDDCRIPDNEGNQIIDEPIYPEGPDAYCVCHLLATRYPGKRSGFIHIPFLPQQVLDKKNMPSMSQDVMVEAIEAAIEAIVDTEEDIKVTGGATH